MKSFVVKSVFHGRLEIPGKKEPLFFGGTHTYVDTLPEKVKYFLGEDKVTITEIQTIEVKKEPEVQVSRQAYDEPRQEKSSSKKSEKTS